MHEPPHVYLGDDALSSVQARELAPALIETADKVDRWAAHNQPSHKSSAQPRKRQWPWSAPATKSPEWPGPCHVRNRDYPAEDAQRLKHSR